MSQDRYRKTWLYYQLSKTAHCIIIDFDDVIDTFAQKKAPQEDF